MGEKDAEMYFQYIREISRPFHLGQDVTGVMCKYRYWKETHQLNFWLWMKVH